jgi:DNA mismatch repair ATPase MutS
VQSKLAEELIVVAEDLNIPRHKIRFFHGKSRYAIEFPTKMIKGKPPSNLIFDSRAKGMSRYTTDVTKNLVKALEGYENDMKNILFGFCEFIFEYLGGERRLFDSFASILSEIDVLICLKEISFETSVNMCRPKLSLRQPDEKAKMIFKDSTLF